jgi:N-acetylglucosamine-6-phosphate deacetylase
MTGMEDGTYDMDGQISIVKDGFCRLENGTINGNMHDLGYCVRKAISFGIPPESAWKMASLNPARVIGIDHITGSVEQGKDADIIVTDDEFNVKFVMVKGKIVYSIL